MRRPLCFYFPYFPTSLLPYFLLPYFPTYFLLSTSYFYTSSATSCPRSAFAAEMILPCSWCGTSS
jgi:hypothetical protein